MCAFTICIDMNAHTIPSFDSWPFLLLFLPEAVPGLGDKSGDTCSG